MADEIKLILETQCLWFEPRRLRQMLLTVDGSGSGLDADKLNGVEGSGYLLATGATTGASSQAQTFTNGIVSPYWRPASDSTTALKVQSADGTNDIIIVNTTDQTVQVKGSNSYTKFRIFKGDGTEAVRVDTSNPVFTVNIPISCDTPTGGVTIDGVDYASKLLVRNDSNTQLFQINTANMVGGIGSGINVGGGGNTWQVIGTTETNLSVSSGSGVTSVEYIKAKSSSGSLTTGDGAAIEFDATSSTTDNRTLGKITWQWATATDASRASKGRLTAYYTSTERECVSWEASSTSAKFGVLGASPAAQQTGGSATAGATYTATEQEMIQKAYDALRTFGFLS